MPSDAADPVDVVRSYDDRSWGDDGPTRGVEASSRPARCSPSRSLAFALDDGERRFLDPRWADVKAKNVSVRWPSGELRGAVGTADDLQALRAMIVRFAEQSEALALRLFPHYRGHLRRGNTSFRPTDVAGRVRSWRQDDTRLHVDAFPSNPMQGTRLLRVFSNVNPNGEPRRWRVGEPFEAHAQRYLGAIGRPLAGSAWLMHNGRHHEAAPHRVRPRHAPAPRPRQGRPAASSSSGPQARVDFAPGTTWVVYSDQVLHAAMGGQHMLEQTFLLDVEHLRQPETSPLRTLERLLHRPLR